MENDNKTYHVLLLLATGAMDQTDIVATRKEIAKLAALPVSIIIVGIGPGNFNGLESLESATGNRFFRNAV